VTDPLNIKVRSPTDITDNHIAFFGCSFTKGVGLTDISESYATQMANSLEKIPLNFAEQGSNNYAMFDIFSQCNFVNENIPVVMQITQLSRVQVYDTQLRKIVLSNNPTPCLLEIYNDKFLIYDM
jgi:hypothetical protein